MNRLAEKLKTAASAASDLTRIIEGHADKLIARKGELEKRTAESFGAHNSVLDQASKGLDDVDAALNLLSNGGPGGPLPGANG